MLVVAFLYVVCLLFIWLLLLFVLFVVLFVSVFFIGVVVFFVGIFVGCCFCLLLLFFCGGFHCGYVTCLLNRVYTLVTPAVDVVHEATQNTCVAAYAGVVFFIHYSCVWAMCFTLILIKFQLVCQVLF